jgi:threonine aldolase
MLGGGMRQAGILAAAALFALEHNRERIADDHDAARRLSAALGAIDNVRVSPVETNIVNVEVPCPAERAVSCARERGVLFNATGPHHLRLVTHLDLARDDVAACVEQTADALRTAIDNG